MIRVALRRAAASLALAGAGAALAQGYGPAAPAAPPAVAPPGIPPRLAQAATLALGTYPALAAARTQIRATQQEVRGARALRLPSAAVQTVTRGTRIGVVTPGVQVVQPLVTFGRVGAGIDRANALRGVAEASLSETALDVLLRLSAAYFEIARTGRLQLLYAESLTEHRRLVASMERRVAQEVSPRTDLELARARAAQVEQQLALVAAQQEAARERFAQLVGEPGFDPGPAPAFSPAQLQGASGDLVRQALACDPTTRRLQAQVAVADADRRLSKAAILPQLGLQYSYDRFEGSQLGLAVRAQTSGGLAPLAAAEAASARAQTARFQVTQAEREVSERVALDLVENRSAGTRMASTQTSATSARNVTESFLRQFAAGRRTWLDVMNAAREAIDARAALVEVENSALSSYARLQLRSCAWAPDAGRGSGS